VLVVYDFRGGDNTLPSLRTVHTDGKAVQGGLAGFRMYDSAVWAHGVGACHSAVRDQQCDHDGVVGRTVVS